MQEAAPLVSHPDGVEILSLRADDKHHLRGVQSRENIRLVLLSEFVLQRYAGEEHLVPLVRQLVVDVLRDGGVLRARAAVGRLLVADEHVERLLLGRDGENVPLDFCDALCLSLIDVALCAARLVQRGEVVDVGQDGVVLHAMAGRNSLMRRGVLHILNAEA